MRIVDEMLTTVNMDGFFPCKQCSNVATKECFDDCIYIGDFRHYKQRPGTDIIELPPFPLEEVINRSDARDRLLAIGIYMTAVVDYLQHMDEYAKIREYYKKNGTIPEDFSI